MDQQLKMNTIRHLTAALDVTRAENSRMEKEIEWIKKIHLEDRSRAELAEDKVAALKLENRELREKIAEAEAEAELFRSEASDLRNAANGDGVSYDLPYLAQRAATVFHAQHSGAGLWQAVVREVMLGYQETSRRMQEYCEPVHSDMNLADQNQENL